MISCDEYSKWSILVECSKDDWTFLEWKRNGIDAHIIFKRVNKLLRFLRRCWLKFRVPFYQVWFSKEWLQSVKNADCVIVQMTYLTMLLPQFVNRINPKARVIAWYWHNVGFETQPDKVLGKCEFWSFDPMDCEKYNMNFNHQYYFKSLIKNGENPEYDVYFCGSDSGRGKVIMDFYKKCQDLGLKIKFQIYKPEYEGVPKELIVSHQSYAKLTQNNLNSRSILEIMRQGQIGATIRQMESLYHKRKLITNCASIKNEPFYNSRNIFIVGERADSELYDFIRSDYDDSTDYLIDKYDVKNWLNNFCR